MIECGYFYCHECIKTSLVWRKEFYPHRCQAEAEIKAELGRKGE